MPVCFIVCPIGDAQSPERKRSDELLDFIIRPACGEYEVIRSDLVRGSDKIDDTILRYLTEAELVIADLTGQNPNVFFEAGYRKALGKPIIFMRERGAPLTFDVAALRSIEYDFHVANIPKIIKVLTETISSVAKREQLRGMTVTEDMTEKMIDLLYEIKDSIEYLDNTITMNDSK